MSDALKLGDKVREIPLREEDRHTPGPWFVGETITARPPGREYPEPAYCVASRVNNAANAHLIASAPDLLIAVKGLLDIIHDDLPHSRQNEHPEVLNAARAALAKAEGRKP